MISQPFVTIGAINYNNGLYVIETLESIKAQTYPNVELVIVDDCSTDNSATLIAEWLVDYSKPFKFIKHPKNLGVCATCNDVIKNASGKFVSLIATDDIMMPDKIKIQASLLEQADSNIGAVYSDAYLMNDDSSLRQGLFIERYRKFDNIPSGHIYNDLLATNFLPAMSLMVKMECYKEVGLFDEELVFEDYDMWLRISKKYEILYSTYISAKYRLRNNSLMTVIRNWDTSTIKILAKHVKDSPSLLPRLEELGVGSYCNSDRASIISLKPLAGYSFKIKFITFLHYFKIPRSIGLFILKRL